MMEIRFTGLTDMIEKMVVLWGLWDLAILLKKDSIIRLVIKFIIITIIDINNIITPDDIRFDR